MAVLVKVFLPLMMLFALASKPQLLPSGLSAVRAIYSQIQPSAQSSIQPATTSENQTDHTHLRRRLHLGSVGYLTDRQGQLHETTLYYPFGESWMEQRRGVQLFPNYAFTGKELDEETGLYYFGARYYDPRTSVWQSVDPILGKYLASNGGTGVFDSKNLALFSYAHQNPVRLIDPDGNFVFLPFLIAAAEAAVTYGSATVIVGGATVIGGSVVAQHAQDPMTREWGATVASVGGDAMMVGSVFTIAGSMALPALQQAQANQTVRNNVSQGMSAAQAQEGIPLASRASVSTPRGPAFQGSSPASTNAFQNVAGGQRVSRIGNFGKTHAGEGQYWGLGNPQQPGFAGQYGAASMNGTAKPDFFIGGRVMPGQPFVTRTAPGAGGNAGGATEVVTPPNAVRLDYFHMP